MARQVRRFSVQRLEEPLMTDTLAATSSTSDGCINSTKASDVPDTPQWNKAPNLVIPQLVVENCSPKDEAKCLIPKDDPHVEATSSQSSVEAGEDSEAPIDPGAYVPLTVYGNGGASDVAERGRQFAARKVRRLVYKDGTCNITSRNVTERNRKYLVDIFTTVVDMKWRYNLTMFAAAFFLSWILFATIWFILAVAHGDSKHRDDSEWKACVANVYDFPTALLFSIETQHTIGYGFRVMEPNCVDAYIVLMIQSCLGVFIQAMMTGIIFAKLSLPKRRAHTIMFSRKSVISKRDGEYCLLFRVGDMRKSHFVGTSIRALLVKDRLTSEGESIPLCQYPLDIQTETCSADNFVFLVWPVTAVHKINSSSPLWNVSAESLVKEQFEIIVILEGIVESTGMTTQVRTSYLPTEILWAHRPASLLAYQKENGVYRIDYSQFHAVVPVSMPDCSAKSLAEKSRLQDNQHEEDPIANKYLTVPFKPNRNRSSMMKRMRSSLLFISKSRGRRGLGDQQRSTGASSDTEGYDDNKVDYLSI